MKAILCHLHIIADVFVCVCVCVQTASCQMDSTALSLERGEKLTSPYYGSSLGTYSGIVAVDAFSNLKVLGKQQ